MIPALRTVLPLAAVPALAAPLAAQIVTPSGLGPDERFGHSLAVSGNTMLVGAPRNETLGPRTGCAYVFTFDGTSWTEQAQLFASNASNNRDFGTAVDIDGDLAVIGAVNFVLDDPYVHVFERSGTTWNEVALAPGVNDTDFGTAVAISGAQVAVGAPRIGAKGAVFTYRYEAGALVPQTTLWGNPATWFAFFGSDLDFDGDTLAIGAPGQNFDGEAFVFTRSGTSWTQEAYLKPGVGSYKDDFGAAVAVCGDRVLVGAPFADPGGVANRGAVHVFDRSGTVWSESATIVSPVVGSGGGFGQSLSLYGPAALIGAPTSPGTVGVSGGKAYSFVLRDGAWGLEQELGTDPSAVSFADYFGHDVVQSGARSLTSAPFAEVGIEGAGTIYGVARDPSGKYYGVNHQDFFRFDGPLSGVRIGPSGFAQGLTYDPSTNLLYAPTATSKLISIEPATGAITVIGDTGSSNINSIALDVSTNTLYAVDRSGTPRLVTLDRNTGAATDVGPVGFTGVFALAFDATNTLIGINSFPDELISIDLNTGAGTFIKSIAEVDVEGMDFHPGIGRMIGYPAESGELVKINPVTSGSNPYWTLHMDDAGVVHSFELDLAESYCTAGTSAAGCAAALTSSGLASASAVSGFDLIATGVEGDKAGILFFGTGGRQANSWGSGSSYQCVVPPVVRAGLLTGTGTAGSCDGSFTQDLNALWCATCPKPAKNPGGGVLIQAQLWYRDPQSTSNQTTSLSDAREVLVGP